TDSAFVDVVNGAIGWGVETKKLVSIGDVLANRGSELVLLGSLAIGELAGSSFVSG
ncbi:23060_t:CDS:2, partial [Gigaspora margarita]